MPRPPHTNSQYESDLRAIEARLLLMIAHADEMVRDAVRAVRERDADRARVVVAADRTVDQLEKEIDQRVAYLFARRSPVGEDLRFAMAMLKVVTDVERIGDCACNIAERALDLVGSAGIDPPPGLDPLTEAVLDELEAMVLALQDRDADAARALAAADTRIDQLNRAAFQQLIEVTRVHPDQFERALAYASVCRNLERVGDHVANVAERIIFLVEGVDVRHGGPGAMGDPPA